MRARTESAREVSTIGTCAPSTMPAAPARPRQIDGVLNDVALGVEIGEDVDRRVSDEQCIGVVGTSMMNTWLIRRACAGRSWPYPRINSSVCRLPFISSSPLPSWMSWTPCAAAASLCGASTIS